MGSPCSFASWPPDHICYLTLVANSTYFELRRMFFERRIALIQEQLVWWSGGLHLAACGMVMVVEDR